MEHATPDDVTTDKDTMVTFTCDAGYQATAGGMTQTVMCDGSDWMGAPEPCKG